MSRNPCSIVQGVIDLHSHILPGLDDGTRSLEEARDLARQAASDGITAIAATPHVRPDYPTTPEEMEWGVDELRADFEAEGIPVQVLYGAEIDLGLLWQIPREELSRLTIGRNRKRKEEATSEKTTHTTKKGGGWGEA